jgi:hypothetical protein
MFPLFTAALPSSAPDLERLLNESLQRVFETESDPATVRDHSYPHLEVINISLDGAQLRSDPPRPPVSAGATSPALKVDQLVLSASPLSLGPASIDLAISARDVQLGQAKDSTGQILLSIENAGDGHAAISATPADLEAFITRLAQDQGNKQGITIDSVQLKVRQESEHSLAAEVRLHARKLFLRASVTVTGQLDLDDQLNLKVSGLKCTGDGGIATLACGVLTPYLEKIEGRKFPLMSLALGEIRLRDVRLDVGDRLSVTAEFGSAI